jgi:hypothetical protein
MGIGTTRARLTVLSLLIGFNGLACGSSPSSAPLTADAFGAQYKFADNEISGWTQDPSDPYSTYTGEEYVQKVDGAAGAYTEKGCRVTMYQSLVGPDPDLCTVLAMDFVTDTQANTMFTWKKQDQNATIVIPPYDASVAIASSTLTGMNVIAHFKASYFELALSGFGAQTGQCTACPVAVQFLDMLKSKTK